MWSGNIQTERDDADVRPGDVISVTGRSEWAGSAALVQRVNFHAGSESAEITVGPPETLGVDSLRDLFTWVANLSGSKLAGDEQLTHAPFEVYKTSEGGHGQVVKIAPGYVNNGDESVSPTWNGTALNAASAPFELFRAGYSRSFFVKITWLPDVDTFIGVDGYGATVVGYRAIATGTITAAEIVNERAAAVAPVVNVLTGVTTPGIFYFPLASAREVNNQLEVTQNLSVDLDLLFIPPNRLIHING